MQMLRKLRRFQREQPWAWKIVIEWNVMLIYSNEIFDLSANFFGKATHYSRGDWQPNKHPDRRRKAEAEMNPDFG